MHVPRKTQNISVALPPTLIEEIDRLVEEGFFTNRCEVIRAAVYTFLRDHHSTWRKRAMEAILASPGEE